MQIDYMQMTLVVVIYVIIVVGFSFFGESGR